MADVIQKCVSAEDVHNGSVVVATSPNHFDEDQARTKSENSEESTAVLESRFTARFDDVSYYSS
jgi:hypothetical protein